MVHFFRSLQHNKTLSELFRSGGWNEKMTWTTKHLITISYFLEYLKDECHEHQRMQWKSSLDPFQEGTVAAMKGKCLRQATIRKKVRKHNDFQQFRHMPKEKGVLQGATHRAFCLFQKLVDHIGDRVPDFQERACANLLVSGPLQINAFMGRIKEFINFKRIDFERQILEEDQDWLALSDQKTIISQGLAGKDVCPGNKELLKRYHSLKVPEEHQCGEKTLFFIPPTSFGKKIQLEQCLRLFSKLLLNGIPINVNAWRKYIETHCKELDRKGALREELLQPKASNANAHSVPTGLGIYVLADAEKKARDGAESFEAVFGGRVDWPSPEEVAKCEINIADFIKNHKEALEATEKASTQQASGEEQKA